MKLATLAAAALAGAALVCMLDRTVFAGQGAIKRTILQRADVPGNPGYEAVMAISELPPGGVGDPHRHHGIELGYVLDGAVTIEHEGRAATTYKAGEPIKIDNGAVHGARNAGTTPLRTLAIYIVEKGKPLAEPVK
jgi:quercetin dioxygenase-like cupin family protein